MKQVAQSMRHGTISVVDVPVPHLVGPGVLVHTAASLISAGTERASLDFARSSLLDKARSRPDLVKQVLDKVRRDGMLSAGRTALARLDKPLSPGYACAGVVLAVADGVDEFAIGDRVACAGAGYATHAEVNYVPRNLVVPIPRRNDGEWVGFDEAAFATLGAIALHGARLAQPQLGDRAVVIGLGVIGLLAVQILRSHGCRVAGIDVDLARCDLARAVGASVACSPDVARGQIASWTRKLGADLVVVAAAANGSEPATLAAELSRDKGRIVAIGATGLDLPRRTLYDKELSLIVSRSYGPGRYDPDYEVRGRDYPLPYVRWTERENLRAFLELVADGNVTARTLISHRFPIADAERAYEKLERESVLGIVLEYPDTVVAAAPVPIWLNQAPGPRPDGKAGISFIGAGSFARGTLLPLFARAPQTRLQGVVTATGLSARSTADKFRFAYCSTSPADVWIDDGCRAVVIATRHHDHASLVQDGVRAGKAVLVEKPLCLSQNELDSIVSTVGGIQQRGGSPFVMVGFNRRFAPATQMMAEFFADGAGPVNLVCRVNAGRVAPGSWITSADEGGGRILGEVCHFVDLCAHLSGSPITEVWAIRSSADADEVIATLRMANGSIATIAYFVNSGPSAPKERIEISSRGAFGIIDDFRRATLTVGGRTRRLGGRFAAQDKGHAGEVQAFVDAVVTGAPSPISFGSVVNSTRATLAILTSLESGAPVSLNSARS